MVGWLCAVAFWNTSILILCVNFVLYCNSALLFEYDSCFCASILLIGNFKQLSHLCKYRVLPLVTGCLGKSWHIELQLLCQCSLCKFYYVFGEQAVVAGKRLASKQLHFSPIHWWCCEIVMAECSSAHEDVFTLPYRWPHSCIHSAQQ